MPHSKARLFFTAMVLAASVASPLAAQEAPILDPPLPPNVADSPEQRMAQRRAAQLGLDQPGLPRLPPTFGAAAPAPPAPGMTDAELKKFAAVITGNDPNAVEDGDRIITQIIPLQNASAPGMVNNLRNFISADADVGSDPASNCIILTDKATRVRRMMEMIVQLDRIAGTRPATVSRPVGRAITAAPPDGTMVGEVTSPTAEIRTPRNGMLAEVRVKPGQKVLKGDVLFRLDARDAQIALEAAQNQVAALESSKREGGAGADTPALAEARTTVKSRQLELESRTILAPLDGIVASVDLHEGVYVTTGTLLTRVVNTGETEVRFHLNGAPMPEVTVGQRLTVKGWPDTDRTATVEVNYLSPDLDTMYYVMSAKPVEPGTLKPGMIVTLTPPAK